MCINLLNKRKILMSKAFVVFFLCLLGICGPYLKSAGFRIIRYALLCECNRTSRATRTTVIQLPRRQRVHEALWSNLIPPNMYSLKSLGVIRILGPALIYCLARIAGERRVNLQSTEPSCFSPEHTTGLKRWGSAIHGSPFPFV